ncbi:fungal-specific transcription factor domain-containing protein [Scheffersomyces xylosifermentans]|uniref:fungal-specific transcription factor domain-containing protein n=1 Tax=Scheffersomyces xylosifermentans TaxID=1304137 RepID=UPI00315D9668
MLPSLQLHNRLQPQLHHGEVNGIAGKNINIPGINNGNGTISRLNNSLALGNHTVHNPQDHHHHHQQQHQQISHQEVQQIAQQSLQHQHQHHPHIAQINISRSQGSEQDESPSLTVPPIRELHQAALQQPFPQNSIQHQQQQPPSAQSSVSSSVSSTSSIPPNSAPHVHKYTTSSIANLLNDAPTPAGAYTKTQSSSSLSNTFSNSPHSNASTTPTNSQHEKFQEESPNETVNNSQVFPFFDQDDLNLLASDLNNIVSNIMYELNFDNKYSKHKTEGENNDITFKGRINDQQSDNVIPRNIPIDYLPVKKSYEKIYLEEFYNEFSQIILPFSSYDAVSKTYFNPARDIILKSASNESFLLAAVLAQGAKLAYQKNNVPEDEEAYCTYLSKCLKLLGPALANGKRGREALTSNIEAILLTVLLLTAANAANSKQDWRAHLKGAKDILLKTSANKVKSSKILIFCKSWFVTLEVLAGISSKLGGTLTSEEEMDMLISSHDEYENSVLKELGIILDNGFNIMGGYHNDCVSSFRELTKLLARKRNQGKDFQQKNSMDFIKLFSEFYKQSEIEFINKKCMLSPSDFENGVIPHGPLVDVLNINSETVIISWMDTSHQSYVLASMITILTNCFQEHYNSPQVQFLTNKIISFVSFLSNASEAPRQMIKCALMMVSWPMLVAGINCEEEDCKYILMKFFRISSQVGSGGAGFALRRISNIWKRHEKGISDSESEDDKSLDLVSY